MAKTPPKRRALGKGLNDILAANVTPEAVEAKVGIQEIPVKQIEPNRYQPREKFDEAALEELAESIRVHGVIQPLTVRRLEENKYELIAGERRLRASKLAGLKTVPAYLRTADDEQMLQMALIENIQREDLNPIEIALSYQRMVDELGLKQSQLGEKVGKNRASVANYLRLLRLPPALVKALRENEITFGHGRALIAVEDPVLQLDLFKEVTKKELSVRQTEALIRAAQNPDKKDAPAPKTAETPEDIQLRDIGRRLEEHFGSKVKLNRGKGGNGQIQISYTSNRDLNRILDLLGL